jgi:hypothetical protein
MGESTECEGTEVECWEAWRWKIIMAQVQVDLKRALNMA